MKKTFEEISENDLTDIGVMVELHEKGTEQKRRVRNVKAEGLELRINEMQAEIEKLQRKQAQVLQLQLKSGKIARFFGDVQIGSSDEVIGINTYEMLFPETAWWAIMQRCEDALKTLYNRKLTNDQVMDVAFKALNDIQKIKQES